MPAAPGPASPSAAYAAGREREREPHSGSSSPYLPQTEEERTEREHQQEADLQLATTMSRGMVVDPGSVRAAVAARSRGMSRGSIVVDHDDEDEDDEDSMDPQRGGEIYRSLRAAQAEQDAHFFDNSGSPSTRKDIHHTSSNRNDRDNQRRRGGDGLADSPHTAAARFYRQNHRRTLSDTSVDSQPGFIDHRNSQASMPLRGSATRRSNNNSSTAASRSSDRHLTPRDLVKRAARRKSSKLRAEMQQQHPQEGNQIASSAPAPLVGAAASSAAAAAIASGEDEDSEEEDDDGEIQEDDDDASQEEQNDDDDEGLADGSPIAAAAGRKNKDRRLRRPTQASTLPTSRPETSNLTDALAAAAAREQRNSFDDDGDDMREETVGERDYAINDGSRHVLEGSALDNEPEDDEPGVVDHRGIVGGRAHQQQRQICPHHGNSLCNCVRRRHSSSSTRSARSNGSHRSNRSDRLDPGSRLRAHSPDHREGNTFTPSMSRRPSDAQKVEEDVCYPLLEMREADMEGRQGGGGGGGSGGSHGVDARRRSGDESPMTREAERQLRHEFAQKYHMGIPGVLPNFPFPFDFDALEEHCQEEREKIGIAIPRARRGHTYNNNADQAGLATSGGSSGVAGDKNRAISFSPDKSDGEGGGGGMRRRMHGHISRRQRKLSESVGTGGGGGGHVGRYQRKLALFEGGSAGGTGLRNDDKADANVKTPLLADRGKGRPSFGATTFGGSHRNANSAAEKSRPYRFSFYSNALPSTIHARSLAEIPADGQTFEELFVGRSTHTPPEEWEGSIVNANGDGGGQQQQTTTLDGFLPGQKPGASSTGHNTPNGGGRGGFDGMAPSLSSFREKNGSISGGKHDLNRSGRASYDQKPRTQVMRSVEDAEANTWWLDVLCPTDAEMKVLGKVFGIHPLTIEDILMEETREKIELFRNYYLVCFRSFDQDPYSPTYLEALNMYIVVFREGTLSFHFRGTPHPQNVRRRIKQLKDFINVTSDWISYALIDDITDAFGPLIQNIEYEVDSIDELVLILKDAEQSDMLRRIGTCRKKVMGLLRLMGNKADVVKGLAKRCNENWSVAPKSDIGLYLSDIQDHLITMTQNLNHYEKILSRSHSNYLAQISIEMTDANNQINDVLSKLTALGTVLIPMNLVTGLWGMNVRVPGEEVQNLHWFFGIVACLLAFALAGGYLTYRAFRK